MPSSRIPDAVNRVLMESFTARDVAEPLASFDASVHARDVLAFMKAKCLNAVGIRSEGQVVGFVEQGNLNGRTCGQCQRPFDEVSVLSDTSPLLTVMMELNRVSFVFINVLGRVGGMITRTDLQKPPVRMWLFGVVTLIEMRFAELIEQHCPGDVWKAFLSEARLQKAQVLLEERNRRNQTLRLFDCLQFSDRGQIIARNEEVRKFTIFASRRHAEETIKKLERLRNNLAHAQDILVNDWDTIVQLCEFINQQ